MLREIHRLTENESARARKWLQESGGRAFVLVHPFFEGSHILRETAQSHPSAISLQKIESLLFPKSGDARTPVFLFEEGQRLEKVFEKIRGLEEKNKGRKRRGIIVVPTEKERPAPKAEGWSELIGRMKKLGAEKLFVCGTFLGTHDRTGGVDQYLFPGWNNEHPRGFVEDELKSGVENDERVAEIEKEHYQKIIDEWGRAAAKKGVSEKEIEENKKRYMEKTNYGATMCVGLAYNSLLLSKAFKTVRIMKKYCE
ncbi:MAG: hypothetical protein NTY90_04825 [Candidatus Micrarchaeota archaeon]|nr:hypothetical protein [Candidatus Micrarchaeota archaeon]